MNEHSNVGWVIQIFIQKDSNVGEHGVWRKYF